ncbi:hypothetical protein PDIP_29560 [Penicillium digitatum Pd1]|uniref:Uncharacterized protein n=1 Tax=Penicillium digitatum (strain Pd1 / CECT 20795) TaxID=1170230 RepID=K9G919_PEND1|nr:hypothetical protein PDIP_29560 [Penicillium digitatum Pd1]EKV17824.1 hypothetical protein PDIP_29560 [Penicillium digitatum Pd1]
MSDETRGEMGHIVLLFTPPPPPTDSGPLTVDSI